MSEQHRQAAKARWKGRSRAERAAFAAQGGRTAQRLGRGHRWTPAEARQFAVEGGRVSGLARQTDTQVEARFQDALRMIRQRTTLSAEDTLMRRYPHRDAHSPDWRGGR